MEHDPFEPLIAQAADWIRDAEGLLIGAGAGMGVDSGLPDFRGAEGFWKAYPPFKELGLHFEDVANPIWFERDLAQAWGFYGHRRNLYRQTQPHAGFELLRRMGATRPRGYFVFTSNVDGHFQRAGIAEDRIDECHGSLEYLQCVANCTNDIWPAEKEPIVIDAETFRALPPFPTCRNCSGPARPNVLMFGDFHWQPERELIQRRAFRTWLHEIPRRKIVAIEIGAGTAIPTVRYECQKYGERLIRINLRDSEAPRGQISLPMGGLAAIQRIAQEVLDEI